MDLYVLRHGKAEPAGPGQSDRDRRLTKKGRGEIESATRWMEAQGLGLDLIAASPLVRAQETAAIVAGQLGKRDCMATWEELAPGGNTDAVCHRIDACADLRSVMVVGHEPLLSGLVSRIVSGNEGAAILMQKGSLARIRDFSLSRSPAGELHWLITASQMAEMR